jgi:hypothetical protein
MTAPTTDLQQVAQFIAEFVHNPGLALQLAQDPGGTLVAQGLDQVDLESVDLNEAMLQACQTPGFPPEAASAIQTYVSGGGGPSSGGYTAPPPPAHGPQPVEHVVQQLQYVNYVTHEGDTTIQQTIIDQSTNVEIGDNFSGSLGGIDVDNAAATGAGSVAGGEGDVNAATGEGSQVIDDSTVGQNQNNSDGSVQVGEDNNAPIVLGPNSGVVNDGDIDAPVLVGSTNTGTINDGNIDGPVLSNSTNTGVVADGPVTDTVVGNENDVANIDGSNSGGIGFGSGAVTSVSGSTVTDSSVGGGTNVSNNSANDGSAINAGSGNATGQSNDTTTTNTTNTTETNTVNATDSVVTTEQGPGDNDSFDNSFQDNDSHSLPEPMKLEEAREADHGPADDDPALA